MSKKIVIVGGGALGSHLLFGLRAQLFTRSGEGLSVCVVDFDVVEQKNLWSQLHTKMSIRKRKSQALQQAMNGLFGIRIESNTNRLEENNKEVILNDAFLIVDCVDNAATRILIQEYAREKNIACLHGALAAGGIFGSVHWNERFVVDEDPEEEQATCEDGAFLPFIQFTSALMAGTIQEFLESGKKRSFNLFPWNVLEI